jgi:hypothetical protein
MKITSINNNFYIRKNVKKVVSAVVLGMAVVSLASKCKKADTFESSQSTYSERANAFLDRKNNNGLKDLMEDLDKFQQETKNSKPETFFDRKIREAHEKNKSN